MTCPRHAALLAAAVLLLAPTWAGAAASRASVSSAERQGNGLSHDPAASADGRFVAFTSLASNLVRGDSNGYSDVFLRDRSTGRTTRVSVSSTGREANRGSYAAAISSDGRYVAFCSYASNLAPGDRRPAGLQDYELEPYRDVFLHDRVSGRTRMVSIGSRVTVGDEQRTPRGGSCDPSIARSGRAVAFRFERTRLPASNVDRRDEVWVWSAASTARVRLDRSPRGRAADGDSATPAISDDGRFVAFNSGASNLVRGDTNGTWDTFVASRTTGSVTRVSRSAAGAQVVGDSLGAVDLSADGRYVLFSSYARALHPSSRDSFADLYVKDRRSGSVRLASSGSSGVEVQSSVLDWDMSLDGRHVAFSTEAAGVAPGGTAGVPNVYLRDLVHRRTRTVASGEQGHYFGARHPALGQGGRFVAFASDATSTVPSDSNGEPDVFLWRP